MKNSLFNSFTKIISSYKYFEYSKPKGISNLIKEKIENYHNLKNLKKTFHNFDKKYILELTETNYMNLRKNLEKKNKSELMKLLSFPLYYKFEEAIENNQKLNIVLNENLDSCKIIKINNYERKNEEEYQKWYQIVLEAMTRDKKNNYLKQYIVLEREENELNEEDWKIFSIQ